MVESKQGSDSSNIVLKPRSKFSDFALKKVIPESVVKKKKESLSMNNIRSFSFRKNIETNQFDQITDPSNKKFNSMNLALLSIPKFS